MLKVQVIQSFFLISSGFVVVLMLCVSLSGICKNLGDGGASSMFHEEIGKCKDMFTVSSAALETNSQAFTMKHLNIIDPLKENNNLGRSVHKGNSFCMI